MRISLSDSEGEVEVFNVEADVIPNGSVDDSFFVYWEVSAGGGPFSPPISDEGIFFFDDASHTTGILALTKVHGLDPICVRASAEGACRDEPLPQQGPWSEPACTAFICDEFCGPE